ncbi:MFS transporter [Blautia coccoides]|uniref:MFS transporter n=1 Tax=Blautia producta TaxID=33035 RepID=UPI002149E25C|nr:MFS transporter [Blautia coccoides]MCR1988579.1 MFS transporter [Blautia coccoides]
MNKTPIFALKLATFVIALGYSLIIPVMPFYMKNLGAGGKELGWLTAIYALTQTLCAPFWGVLSDRIGRKPIISIGMLGYTISLLLFGLASSFCTLFIARALSGVLSSATSVASLAYVGDSSTEDERSKNMGQLGAAMSVGVMLGPLFGGILAGYSLVLPFFTGAGISFIAFLLIVTVLPESIERSGYPHKKDSFDFLALKSMLLGPAGVILILIFIVNFCQTGLQGITGLYVVDKFGFTTGQVGVVWMVVAGVLIVVQGFFTGPLENKTGDKLLILIGIFCKAMVAFAMVLTSGFISVLVIFGLFAVSSALTVPTLNASLSKEANQRKGILMGFASTAGNLSKVIAPLLAGYLYERSIELPYITMGAIALIGTIICFIWKKTVR